MIPSPWWGGQISATGCLLFFPYRNEERSF
jgi:hypothetical protein